MKYVLTLLTMLTWCSYTWAQDAPVKNRVYETQRVNPHSPDVDGKLDDPAWQGVPWSGDFTQNSPVSGDPPSQETQFKILYDEKNLYIGIRAFDTEPQQIVNRVSRRDDFDSDWVEVNIDSYYDKRTAFSFTLTPAAG